MSVVIPAEAGIQVASDPMAGRTVKLGPGLRRGDNQIRHVRRGDNQIRHLRRSDNQIRHLRRGDD